MITEEMIKRESRQYDCKVIHGLRLERKGLHQISNLICLGDIVELSLAQNQISCIEGLETLTALEVLDLSDNKISRIRNLKTLTRLKKVNLSANYIGSIECLTELTDLTELRSLKLQDSDGSQSNPVCKASNYHKTVLKLLPGLLILDGGNIEVLKSFLSVTKRSGASYELLPVPSLEHWIGPVGDNVSCFLTLTMTSGSSSSSSNSSSKSNNSSSEEKDGGTSSSSSSIRHNSSGNILEGSDRGRDNPRGKSSAGRKRSIDPGHNADRTIADILDNIAKTLNVDSEVLLLQAETALENAGYLCQKYS